MTDLNKYKDDLTPFEAELDAIHEDFERKQQAWKAQIIGSATEMDIVILSTPHELRMKIMKMIADLTDSGLELDNPHCSSVLPEQVKDLVIELAKYVESAIEEYINE